MMTQPRAGICSALQQVGAAGIGLNVESFDPEREFERAAHGRIVVDDDDCILFLFRLTSARSLRNLLGPGRDDRGTVAYEVITAINALI